MQKSTFKKGKEGGLDKLIHLISTDAKSTFNTKFKECVNLRLIAGQAFKRTDQFEQLRQPPHSVNERQEARKKWIAQALKETSSYINRVSDEVFKGLIEFLNDKDTVKLLPLIETDHTDSAKEVKPWKITVAAHRINTDHIEQGAHVVYSAKEVKLFIITMILPQLFKQAVESSSLSSDPEVNYSGVAKLGL